MNAKKFDIAIAYRVYPKVSKRTYVFQYDKFKLVKLCLKSFKKSLGDLKVKLFVLLDGCPDEYETLFRSLFSEDEIKIYRFDGIGNKATFEKQIDILLNQNFSDTIYFAEDDYFYLPGQFKNLLEFLKGLPGGAFISPYDHPDYYSLLFHRNKHKVHVIENRHWRTANSTCLTFLTTKDVLLKTQSVFRTYAHNNFDSSLWLSLTKNNLYNPVLMVRFLASEPFYLKSIYKSWLHCWRQILFGRKWDLWIPIPTIATHMDEVYLSNGINWKTIIDPEVEKIEAEYKKLSSNLSIGDYLS
ncbi:MAG: glycosyltransferase family 2 protein [Candidatus Zhuqueibacterota bacterium]